jgi:arylsulfatase
LLILLDDVGFAQLGCFGSDISTPTFDRLAANGLRYRDFHTTALCTPSRACLLTGRNHHTCGVGVIPEMGTGFPGYNGLIGRENAFLSEMLAGQGYASYAIGKWHLTPASEYASGSTRARWPLGRGFERFYGFLAGMTNHWVPDLVHDSHFVDPPATPEEGYHLNADLADHAIAFVKDLKTVSPDKPFFLYYALGAGHAPHQAPREWIERERGRFDQGWDAWRDAVFARQLAMGIVPPGTRLSPRPEWVPAWDSLSADQQRLFARQMEVFAAFMAHTDYHVGRVIDFLEEIGQLDNTLILVTSDNGASAEAGVNGSFNQLLFSNGVTPGLEKNLEMLDAWGDPTTYANYSWGWAWAGCAPLRRWKRYLHQGGMSDPMIVHWPARIHARGELRGQYIHAIDVVPTVLEALGIDAPSDVNGVTQNPIHGVSFAHTFDDLDAPTYKAAQYYEMFGSRAIWSDGWKAVAEQEQGVMLTEQGLRDQRWELYHVAEDFSETEDLAERYPEKLRELIDLWWAEAGRYDVLPLDARVQQRFAEPKPRLSRETSRYVYYPDAAPLLDYVAVNIKNRSHSITASVIIPENGAEGVLLAQGSRFAGYSLFVKEGTLHYVHNYLGLAQYWVRSTERIPPGEHVLRYEFTKTGEHRGDGRLLVDGREVGRGTIEQTVPNVFDVTAEGLCCGYDSGLPVTDEYRAPYRFTGTIRRVIVDVEGAAFVDAAAHARATLAAE